MAGVSFPIPNIACSGIPVKAPVDEWKRLAGGDERLEKALVRLHMLFRDADTLGSLIDPKQACRVQPTLLGVSGRSTMLNGMKFRSILRQSRRQPTPWTPPLGPWR